MSEYPQHSAPRVRQMDSREAPGASFGAPSRKPQKPQKKRSKFWTAVFWVALVVFVCSLAALGYLGYGYLKGQMEYKEIAKIGFDAEDHEGASLADMQVDWDALWAINPEVVGWVYMPGTAINYPIMQASDNEKYLTTDFYNNKNGIVSYGSIFLDAENASDFSDENNLIYGHHMNDGSMFAVIDTFVDSAKFNEHRTVFVLAPQGNYRLDTFSLVVVPAYDPLAQFAFSSSEEWLSYIQDKLDRSVVLPDPVTADPASMSKIFSFVTCDYSIYDGRAVLFASVVESTVDASQESLDLINPDDVAAVGDATKEM